MEVSPPPPEPSALPPQSRDEGATILETIFNLRATPLLESFSCAYLDVTPMRHGRLYIAPTCIAFYSTLWLFSDVTFVLHRAAVEDVRRSYFLGSVRTITIDARDADTHELKTYKFGSFFGAHGEECATLCETVLGCVRAAPPPPSSGASPSPTARDARAAATAPDAPAPPQFFSPQRTRSGSSLIEADRAARSASLPRSIAQLRAAAASTAAAQAADCCVPVIGINGGGGSGSGRGGGASTGRVPEAPASFWAALTVVRRFGSAVPPSSARVSVVVVRAGSGAVVGRILGVGPGAGASRG